MKKRIDLLLVDKKIAENRSKAQAMIMAGQVFIDGNKILKSGEMHNTKSIIKVKDLHPQWVSRGALKLIHIIEKYNIDIKNYICLDIGASTGGFTQVLLSKQVKKVYCVDVGLNQLHEKLSNNKRVINISKTNARYLSIDLIVDKIDLIVCDVSFISMKKVIEPSLHFLDQKKGIIMLGVPSNDFGNQEPGSNKEIKNFCEAKFGITFPMTEKVSVKGNNAHPFYIWAKKNYGKSAVPKWNFHKIIIDKTGKIGEIFSSITNPSSKKVIAALEKLISS